MCASLILQIRRCMRGQFHSEVGWEINTAKEYIPLIILKLGFEFMSDSIVFVLTVILT